jgi:hypothetical protein
MKKAIFVLLCVTLFSCFAMAQVTYTDSTGTPIGNVTPVDKLGAHENGGRGCVGCHAPHSGAAGNGGNVGTGTVVDTQNAGNDALWGQDLGPLYGYTLNMGDNGAYVTTLPASSVFAVADEEIRGIMMCLSCHDGNIAKGAMMTNQSWEQKMGLLPTTYGTKAIPTLLGLDGTAAGNYNNDHPVGPQATLGKVGVASRFTVTGGKYATADAQYLEFIGNYGAPTFFGRTPPVLPTGFVDGTAPTNAYIVCTTCHTPHSMYTSSASATNKIKGLSAGVFPSFFFIAAPYNPSSTPTASQASSATQFCRQCHFTGAGGSNEGSNIHGVTTAF